MQDVTHGTEGSLPKTPRKGMTSAQKKFYIGAALIVGSISYLIYSAIETSANYYYKVSEIKAMGDRAFGIPLRIEGKVEAGSIQDDKANLKIVFNVVDESNHSIPVYYEGVAPDMMQDDINVVVEGSLDSSGRIIATRVLTSCPSRYEASEEFKNGSHPGSKE